MFQRICVKLIKLLLKVKFFPCALKMQLWILQGNTQSCLHLFSKLGKKSKLRRQMLNKNTGIKYWQSKLFLMCWIKSSSILIKRKKIGPKKKTRLHIHVMLNTIGNGKRFRLLPRRKMIKNTTKLNQKSVISLIVSLAKNKKSKAPKSHLKLSFSLCLKMKIWHFQFCSSCTCLRIIKFFPI
jgi:hypothetical protein